MKTLRTLTRNPARVILAVIAAAGIASTGSPAAAHDHAPPRTVLRVDGETVQRGLLGTHCWTTRSGDGYVTGCGDSVWSFPAAEYVDPGSRVTLRIAKAQRPQELTIYAWKRLDEHGQPAGRAIELRSRGRPVRLENRVVWEFSFTLTDAPRHYYLDVFGVWRDQEGARVSQDASWTFHIRTSR